MSISIPGLGKSADTSDAQDMMLSKLNHAFKTYDSASKKYLSAAKEFDSALEGIAISFRELSQGDLNDDVRGQCNALCSAIDAHKSADAAKAAATEAATAPGGGCSGYFFTQYMADFNAQISGVLDALKTDVRAIEKAKSKRDEAAKRYQKLRGEADGTETKLARKNQGINDNPKYLEKASKRDAAKLAAETEEHAFNQQYEALMLKRERAVVDTVTAMGSLGGRYYDGVARVMRAQVA